MANFPGSWNSMPWADPPYSMFIRKDGKVLIETDNCGIIFKILGNVHTAAVLLLEKILEDNKRVISPLTGKREDRWGAVTFIFMDNQLVDVEPSQKKAYPAFNIKAEDRPEVFTFINALKSVIKMKAFW
jgi:hypothetical protein